MLFRAGGRANSNGGYDGGDTVVAAAAALSAFAQWFQTAKTRQNMFTWSVFTNFFMRASFSRFTIWFPFPVVIRLTFTNFSSLILGGILKFGPVHCVASSAPCTCWVVLDYGFATKAKRCNQGTGMRTPWIYCYLLKKEEDYSDVDQLLMEPLAKLDPKEHHLILCNGID